jgi:hypothetical protein
VRLNAAPTGVAYESVQKWVWVCGQVLVAALAGWTALVASEAILLFGVLRLFAVVMGPELLPSLKVVFDMAALAACGWIAGRVGRPRVVAAAAFTAFGLAVFDLSPYVPLNVPWLLRVTRNAFGESRYVSSLLAALTMHALVFGSLFAGARLSRPREVPLALRFDR